MSGFKLLAIRPLEGCDAQFRKNLKEGVVYKFYQDYKFFDSAEKEILESNGNLERDIATIKPPKEELNLYSDGDLKINISAVVGENGSGKSALIELLYLLIYSVCIKKENGKGKSILEKRSVKYENIRSYLKGKYAELNTDEDAYLAGHVHKIEGLKFKETKDNLSYVLSVKETLKLKIENVYKQKITERDFEYELNEKLNVSLLFTDGKNYFHVNQSQGILKHGHLNNESSEIDLLDLKRLFYTISLNYSHHALNSKSLGTWIESLFHKNDGYITPVVINPMRTEGNFDINKELHLSNERLIQIVAYEIAQKGQSELLKKYQLKEIQFRTKKSIRPILLKDFFENQKTKVILKKDCYDSIKFENLISVKLVKELFRIDLKQKYFNFLEYAIGYLETKINLVFEEYPHLFEQKGEIFNQEKIVEFLKFDKSHLTKKIRQTLTFINLAYSNPKYSDIFAKNSLNYATAYFPIIQYSKMLFSINEDLKKISSEELVEFAHPGFFNVDYLLEYGNGQEIKLSKLSSGEQQMIFNISTIVYHLYNLQSVHKSSFARVKYENIFITLDEVELYYHPEMQRELVKNLLSALNNLNFKKISKNQTSITSIHILFSTHSPFILSDIPSNNILRLENGEPSIKQFDETFGANIHQLLHNDFFLQNGFMGEFAQEQINKTINWIIDEKRDMGLKENHKNLINIIGEPILKMKLMEMFDEACGENMELSFLQSRIDELKNKSQ